METGLLLTILLVAGFIVAASAIMAVLAWGLVVYFRAREKRQGSGAGSEQSAVIADGVFELAGEHELFGAEDDDPQGRVSRSRR